MATFTWTRGEVVLSLEMPDEVVEAMRREHGTPFDIELGVWCDRSEQFERIVEALGGLGRFDPINVSRGSSNRVAIDGSAPDGGEGPATLDVAVWMPSDMTTSKPGVDPAKQELRERQERELAAAQSERA